MISTARFLLASHSNYSVARRLYLKDTHDRACVHHHRHVAVMAADTRIHHLVKAGDAAVLNCCIAPLRNPEKRTKSSHYSKDRNGQRGLYSLDLSDESEQEPVS